jgi:hypothetical protein
MSKQGKLKKAIRLIDIPGLGGSGGIRVDKQRIDMIHQRLKDSVPFINLIIYLFKANENRVTT